MKLEDYEQYYIENSEHYLIHKDAFKELFDEMVSWRNEAKKQKLNHKQLRSLYKIHLSMRKLIRKNKELQHENENLKNWKELHRCTILAKQNIKLFNQQKEFIRYIKDISNYYNGVPLRVINEILEKFKEIIGDDNGGIMD